MRFDDFIAFDDAATALYDDASGQQHCRACLCRLLETAKRHSGKFVAEAAKRDVRRGVAFRQKALDDMEHGVFAQRLAQKLWKRPDAAKKSSPNYGDFLHQGILKQGEVLGDIKWEVWEVAKQALALGGINPNELLEPRKSPAQRLALIGKLNWQNVTLPKLKARLGSSFAVPDDWRRQFGIERLQKIKSAVEQGKPVTDPNERRLLGIWRTLEVQLGSQILPAGPHSDVGLTRLPMSPNDRKRFYKTLTGQANESVAAAQTPLRLSPQSVYDLLTQKYDVEVISDEEAKDLYLSRILQDLHNKSAFIPSFPQGSETDRKRWRDAAARSWGGFLPAARFFDPSNTPGVAQRISGMTTRGFKTRTNASGRRVPYAYGEPEEFQRSGGSADMPGIKYPIDVLSSEVSDPKINAFYRTPEGNAAVQQELVKPATDAVNWLRRQGWNIDSTKMNDYVQQVVIGMLHRTGAVSNWRANIGFRRATAMMLARRYASQGWPSARTERTGHTGGRREQPGTLDMATGNNRDRGEDDFSSMRGGVAKARTVIQRAMASLLDMDTSRMGGDEESFVDALEKLSDPDKAIAALGILDNLSARYERELPQVKRAVDRIHRHLEPLVTKVRGAAD